MFLQVVAEKKVTPQSMDLEVLGSTEQAKKEEAPNMMAEEAQPSIPEEHSPLNIVKRVLGELAPQEKVAESESDGKGDSNNIPIVVPKENKEDQPVNKLVEQPTVQIRERRSK